SELALEAVRYRAGRALQRVQEDADGGDSLPDLVVQLARDAAPFGLERVQQPAGEAVLRRLGLLAVADVADHPEEVRLAGPLDARGAHLDRDQRAVLAPGPRRARRPRPAPRSGP